MALLSDANTKFAIDVFNRVLTETPTGNIFFSPFSVSAALGMVDLGARGDTAKQMEKVLHFNEITGSGSSVNSCATEMKCDKPGGPHIQFKALLSAINQHSKNYTLSTANRLYGEEKYTFLPQYLYCTKEMYHAELEKVDFKNAAEEVRKKINAWVESQTNGKIKDLLPSDSIDASTLLVLVNAIYFKGSWKFRFDKKHTHEATFWTDKNQSKTVQMMSLEGEFNVAKMKNPPMQVLQLPYDNNDLSMFILLPDNRGGADEIELTYTKFQEWTSLEKMQKKKLNIFVPKFKLEEAYDLEKILIALGMTDLFSDEKADLSGMTGSHALKVSRVVHKAYVEVNEEGTEAAAATGVPSTTSLPPEFRVNHTFFFCIIHNQTKSILFIGKCSSP
ncbi:serpin B3-like [Rhineura floridana]|uniref:serpin B3-like n=1 Tax=Rhineura floridana TaxID=261503 RepID=UPI002AC88D6F|nr:serpin B3-like [Rhineura floridana]